MPDGHQELYPDSESFNLSTQKILIAWTIYK